MFISCFPLFMILFLFYLPHFLPLSVQSLSFTPPFHLSLHLSFPISPFLLFFPCFNLTNFFPRHLQFPPLLSSFSILHICPFFCSPFIPFLYFIFPLSVSPLHLSLSLLLHSSPPPPRSLLPSSVEARPGGL